MQSPELAIVICNFNKKDYLRGCLDSVLESLLPDVFYQVFVVDNASSDGSVELIRDEYAGRVNLIALDSNSGGSGGFHRGINEAMASKAQYIALLDNDILLDQSTLQTLLSYIKTSPEAGVVGAKICVMDQPDILQELGSFIDWQTFNVKTPYKGYSDRASLPEVVECDYVPACCLITKREVIERAGNFDCQHFIYWDDMDWCTRVRMAGYKVHAIRNARVLHKMGAVNTLNTFSNYYFERNRVLYFMKHSSRHTFSDFTEKLMLQIMSQCFFASRKQVPNNVISTLLGITDIFADNLFAQPQQIFTKQQIDPLEKLQLGNYTKIYLLPCEDLVSNRRVAEALLQRIDSKVELIADPQGNAQFGLPQILNISPASESLNKMSDILTIKIVPHILDANQNDVIDWIIDGYFNQCQANELKQLHKDFLHFQTIFKDTLLPVFKQQLAHSYDRYRLKKNLPMPRGIG